MGARCQQNSFAGTQVFTLIPFNPYNTNPWGSYFILLRIGHSLAPSSFPFSPSSSSSRRQEMVSLKCSFQRSTSLPPPLELGEAPYCLVDQVRLPNLAFRAFHHPSISPSIISSKLLTCSWMSSPHLAPLVIYFLDCNMRPNFSLNDLFILWNSAHHLT